MDYLLIKAEFVNPPSESFVLRDITMISKGVKLNSLIEVQKEYRDIYYSCYKSIPGLTDFIEDFVTPEESPFGITITDIIQRPFSIITDRITLEKEISILGQIKFLSGI